MGSTAVAAPGTVGRTGAAGRSRVAGIGRALLQASPLHHRSLDHNGPLPAADGVRTPRPPSGKSAGSEDPASLIREAKRLGRRRTFAAGEPAWGERPATSTQTLAALQHIATARGAGNPVHPFGPYARRTPPCAIASPLWRPRSSATTSRSGSRPGTLSYAGSPTNSARIRSIWASAAAGSGPFSMARAACCSSSSVAMPISVVDSAALAIT